MRRKQQKPPHNLIAAPRPIELLADGAVMGLLNQAIQTEVVRVALHAYCEGRGLQGDWEVRIIGVRLTPKVAPVPATIKDGKQAERRA